MARKLTKEEKSTMLLIQNGGDVYSPSDAMRLRRVEKELPGLIEITKAMHAPKDGAMQQPYFGAILTRAGRLAVGLRR